MRALVVEDEFVARRVLQRFLSQFGVCDVAVDGEEAFEAIRVALADGAQYDLVCLDIGLPRLDGQSVLEKIRAVERERDIQLGKGARVIMTTGDSSKTNVMGAFRGGADAYLVKPITLQKLVEELTSLGLVRP